MLQLTQFAASQTWRQANTSRGLIKKLNLLLRAVIDYKAGKAGGGVYWETVTSKYEDGMRILRKWHKNGKYL